MRSGVPTGRRARQVDPDRTRSVTKNALWMLTGLDQTPRVAASGVLQLRVRSFDYGTDYFVTVGDRRT
jgi:hypothetical protein